jgi:hypothetical protein
VFSLIPKENGTILKEVCKIEETDIVFCRLGSVAGPVIQATGRSEFEDGLGSGRVTLWRATHIT